MNLIADRTAEADHIIERAGTEWLADETILALAPVRPLAVDEWMVRGLDHTGHESPTVRADHAPDDAADLDRVAVQGAYPSCSAARLYRAATDDHAWLVLTETRVAVVHLDDAPDNAEGVELVCGFELPRHALASIAPWQQPDGAGPEVEAEASFVQVSFADSSWARLRTDRSGLTALSG